MVRDWENFKTDLFLAPVCPVSPRLWSGGHSLHGSGSAEYLSNVCTDAIFVHKSRGHTLCYYEDQRLRFHHLILISLLGFSPVSSIWAMCLSHRVTLLTASRDPTHYSFPRISTPTPTLPAGSSWVEGCQASCSTSVALLPHWTGGMMEKVLHCDGKHGPRGCNALLLF